MNRRHGRFHKKTEAKRVFSRWKYSNENSQDPSDSLVRNKGKLHPPKNRNKVLDTIIDFLHRHNFEEHTASLLNGLSSSLR